jgi:hypothetical protein
MVNAPSPPATGDLNQPTVPWTAIEPRCMLPPGRRAGNLSRTPLS